jgi:DNA ligase-4
VRIILKDLKLGLKFDAVMGEFHKDAHDYFNLTNSLKEVCRKFEDKNASLENELMLFHPIKPMLAGKKPLEYFDTQ